MKKHKSVNLHHLLKIMLVLILEIVSCVAFGETVGAPNGSDNRLFESFCASCHSGDSPEGKFDIGALLQGSSSTIDSELPFEHLITGRMPPVDADQPSQRERLQMADLLAERQETVMPSSGRRLSRFS